jgi:hypothetical protein
MAEKTVIYKTWKGSNVPKEPVAVITKDGKIYETWKGSTVPKKQVGKIVQK